MKILQRGSKGIQVTFLQRLLNKAATRDGVIGTWLSEDGDFGAQTDSALRAFQTRHKPLVVDGSAGIQTWNALGLKAEKEHNQIRLFAQPTDMTCWSAAATMILGNQSVGPGIAELEGSGGLGTTISNVQKFAAGLGWQMFNYTPSVQVLVNQVRKTPVWIGVLHSTGAHAVVLSGVYSDGAGEGDGTMFRVHDPWPAGQGKIYGSFADPLILIDRVTRYPVSLEAVLYPY